MTQPALEKALGKTLKTNKMIFKMPGNGLRKENVSFKGLGANCSSHLWDDVKIIPGIQVPLVSGQGLKPETLIRGIPQIPGNPFITISSQYHIITFSLIPSTRS